MSKKILLSIAIMGCAYFQTNTIFFKKSEPTAQETVLFHRIVDAQGNKDNDIYTEEKSLGELEKETEIKDFKLIWNRMKPSGKKGELLQKDMEQIPTLKKLTNAVFYKNLNAICNVIDYTDTPSKDNKIARLFEGLKIGFYQTCGEMLIDKKTGKIMNAFVYGDVNNNYDYDNRRCQDLANRIDKGEFDKYAVNRKAHILN
jgi:hypothetical protein